MKKPAAPTARRRNPLTRERVLDAALKLVDRNGLDALSMRELGAALKVEAMSVYRHVPSKAALLEGLQEAVLAEVRLPEERAWRPALEGLAAALRQAARAHPNTLSIVATRPLPPAFRARLGPVAETLARTKLPPNRVPFALEAVTAFALGHALTPSADGDSSFAWGLATLLDGLATRVAGAAESLAD
jgi:AcrR family transcriptional regulator